MFFSLLPITLLIVSVAVWVAMAGIKRSFYGTVDKIVSTYVVLLFLVYPTIAKVLFAAVNCMSVAGTNRLREDLESICYKGSHLAYFLGVVIPGSIIWVLGIPLIALIILLRNRKTIL